MGSFSHSAGSQLSIIYNKGHVSCFSLPAIFLDDFHPLSTRSCPQPLEFAVDRCGYWGRAWRTPARRHTQTISRVYRGTSEHANILWFADKVKVKPAEEHCKCDCRLQSSKLVAD